MDTTQLATTIVAALTTTPSTTFPPAPASPAPVPLDHPYIVFAREVYIWLVPIMIIVLLVAVIGNGLIVLLCISLAAADAWAGSLLITGLIMNSYFPVVLRMQKKSECVPAFLEIFRISGMLTSNLHILALALNQFIGIVHPIRYKIMLTTRRLRVLIFLLWLLPVFFVGSWYVMQPGDGFWHPQCKQRFYNRLPFRLSVFIAFIVPLLITFFLYGCIVRSLLVAKAKTAHDTFCSKQLPEESQIANEAYVYNFADPVDICSIVGRLRFVLRSLNFYVGFLLNSTVNFLVALKLLFNPLIYALRMDHIRSSVINFFSQVFFWSRLKRKSFIETGSPKSERTTHKSLALSRTTSCQSSHAKSRALSISRRPYEDEAPRVLTDLVHLIDNDISLHTSGLETPSRLTVKELSFCSSASSMDYGT
ncbi:G-PROTEIN-RECEP-F1-2 domain-containing protein [Aphelenchoides bicaudatus]|nr:G-PROTEIN-RECEP-F1-2 domain-containing protein [Aphelenchoides bicaudatus]